MKRFFMMLLCVLIYVSAFPEMRTVAAGSYGKEVNFKPTSSSKKYLSDAADKLGVTLYENADDVITSFEVACTMQRLLNEVNGADTTLQKSISGLTNYMDMAVPKLIKQIYYVGALDVKNKRILVKTECTRLELARQLAYYDEYFEVYEMRDAVKLVDTKSAYAKYAYQAGLLDAPARKFKPNDEVTLEDFLVVLVNLYENSSVDIDIEDIQKALVKSFKITKKSGIVISEDAMKIEPNSVESFKINVKNLDEVWSENTSLVDIQAIDITNSSVVLEAYSKEGVTNIIGIRNGKREHLFEIVIGDGIENRKIEIADAVIGAGDSIALNYEFPGDEKLQWGSSDPSIATVKSGVVTGVSDGVCEITCWSNSYIGTAKVTVLKNNLKLASNKIMLKSGKSYSMEVKVNGVVTSSYSTASSNYNVAFEAGGYIFARGIGTAVITFTAVDGSRQECVVIVK